MDLENQKRVKEFADQYGPENIVVLLGAAEGELLDSLLILQVHCTSGRSDEALRRGK